MPDVCKKHISAAVFQVEVCDAVRAGLSIGGVRFNLKRLLVRLIRAYQKHISARTAPHCRFYPTCSNYAVEAIERFGAVRGIILSAWRVLRCNPFCQAGYDPVPQKFAWGQRRREQNERREQMEREYGSEYFDSYDEEYPCSEDNRESDDD